MKTMKWITALGLALTLIQPVSLYAEEEIEETTQEESMPSIYDLDITSKVKAGQANATTSNPATLTQKQAKKGVEVVDTIKYEGLMPDEKYEIACELVYYEGNQEKVVTETYVTKKSSDTGEGKWEISLDTIKGLKSGVRYHVYEEITSKKAFEFQEGIQKQTYTQQDPYANETMIAVAEVDEIPPASKEVTFYGRDKYKHPMYAVIQMTDTGTSENTLESWEDNEPHTLILSEGTYALIEYKDAETQEFAKSVYFHLANDGTIELRLDNKWVKPEKDEVSINGIVKKEKKKVKAEETETATAYNIFGLLGLLMVALIVAVKIFCSRIFQVN